MSSFDIIRHRRSVRTFDGRALRAEDAEKIMEYASALENPYGLPITWKILNAKEHGLSSPVITGTDTYITGKMKRAPHAEEAFGYTFERIVIFAEAMKLGTTWIAGTMNRDAFEKAMELDDGEVMPCISTRADQRAILTRPAGTCRRSTSGSPFATSPAGWKIWNGKLIS